MSADRPLINQLCRRLEGIAHRDGWDNGDAWRIFVLFDTRDAGTLRTYRDMLERYGPLVCVGHLGALSLPPGPSGYISHHLFRLALNVRARTMDGEQHPLVRMMLDPLRRPGLVGFAVLTETWARHDPTPQENRQLFANLPGSFEARVVAAADIDGGYYHVVRHRDTNMVLTAGESDDPDAVVAGGPHGVRSGGQMFECLHLLAAAVAGRPLPELTETPHAWDWGEQVRA